MNQFNSEPEKIIRDQLEAMERVIRSGWYILGSEVREFESEWADVVGARYSVGVGNGMDAIEIGLRAIKVGTGDEVITTPMTAFATVLAIIKTGATPVFADIDTETGLMNLESANRCITKKTKAILLVHLYGQVKFMNQWAALCEKNDIDLVEDCAQAHLAKWDGMSAGTYGSFGTYSFYPTKNLGALGDAGALVTDSLVLNEAAKVLRNYGQDERYSHPVVGLNSRLDEIQAAVLRVRLAVLGEYTERRKTISALYFSKIKNTKIKLLSRPFREENHVFHLFVIRCEERDNLSKYLADRNVESLIHYPIPLHKQPPCTGYRRDPHGVMNSEEHASQCLSIPCNPHLKDFEVEKIVDILNEF